MLVFVGIMAPETVNKDRGSAVAAGLLHMPHQPGGRAQKPCVVAISELVGLPLSALSRDGVMLVVRGKGEKERMVPLSEPARDAVDAYLTVRETFVPERRTLPATEMHGGRSPGSEFNPNPLYRLPLWAIGVKLFSGTAIGAYQDEYSILQRRLSLL